MQLNVPATFLPPCRFVPDNIELSRPADPRNAATVLQVLADPSTQLPRGRLQRLVMSLQLQMVLAVETILLIYLDFFVV